MEEINNLYSDSEWVPVISDKNWKKLESDFYQYNIKNQPEIIYLIDANLRKIAKKILELKKKIKKPIVYSNDNDYKIIKIYRIYDQETSIIGYTTLSILRSIKIMYENYLEDKENHLNYFNDISKVKIELLECYKSKNIPRITINEIKNKLMKKYTKNENILNIYLEIAEKLYKEHQIKKTKSYFIYNLNNKAKNFLFYTKEKINSKNKENILNENFNKQKIKPFNGEVELISEEKLYSDTYAQILLESFIYNKTINSINRYFIYDNEITPNQLIKIKRRIESFINMEKIDKYLNDYSDEEYKDIFGICYSIKVNNKYFIDITINKTVTEIIKNLYLNNVASKYKKLSKEIKNVDFNKDVEVNFEYVANKEEDKENLTKIKRKLVRQYKAYDKDQGLNQKPFNIYKRSFYSK